METMSNPMNQVITWNEAKMLTGFGSVLVSVVLAWASLNSHLALIDQRQESLIDSATGTTNRLQVVEDKQNELALAVARIATIIDDAKSRGLLSSAALKNPGISSAPTPTPTYSYTFVSSTNMPDKSSPSQTLPQTPTPTPTPSPVLSLLQIQNLIGKR